ncbi:hypothetical protein [Corynebacterium cystitidis]|uniref:Phage integrase family protein n=1 Tax=Corynebacterium cystitidis DSM 20524 TaxID=1121357 RepID=A0A1H9WMI9_9CORY|nr:hypothetical protein [Corynebacterium cystitidis]WJY82830.1 hypothetical protein CCYS_09580 [Corynebacterium cystitidis DSM 20524]SES35156.1 hypothetical protein SAMN05661109_02821 [Corynebacterium cystitidis DSM 20524]SNV70064.1 Uncharacterised protein [Corynebacterium cystitidis]
MQIWLSDDPAIAWLDRHSIALASRPKPRYAGGYSLTELAAIFSWASTHSTQVRRDLCVGVVALAFGAGLSTSEIREVKTEDIALDGSTVVVGDSRLSVRDEVCNALADLRARDVFPLPDTRYISTMKQPQGIHVTPRRLMLSWAVAKMAEGTTLQAVTSRIPRATALRAMEEVSGFGSWPEGVILRNVVSDYAGADKRTKGTRKPKAKAGKQSNSEPSQTYPRLRLIEGG